MRQEDKAGKVVRRTGNEECTPAFGGLAVIVEEPREYCFTAETDVTVSKLTKAALRVCFKAFPSAEDAVLTAVLKKYNRTSGVDLTSCSNPELVHMTQQNIDKLQGPARTMGEEKQRIATKELLRRAELGSQAEAAR